MIKFFTSALLFIFLNIQIQAQETLNLNDAINTALKNSTSVSTLEKTLHIQELSTKTSIGNMIPSLSLNANWSRNNTFSEGTVRFENGVPIIIPKQNTWINNFSLGANTQVTLFNGFSNLRQVDLEKENETSIKIKLDKEKYDIVYKVNTVYFDLLKKEKIVTVNQDNLKDSRDQLNKIKEFMNVGKKTMSDVYKQDVQVAQNELTLERSINEFKKSKVDLLLAMNSDLNAEFNPSNEGIKTDLNEGDLKLIINRNSDMDMLVNKATEKRLDYRSSLQDIKIGETQLSIDSKNLYFPTISGFASYNLNASRIENIVDSRSLSFGLSLSYPIFQGFKLDNKRQTSEISIKQKQDALNLLTLQMRSDLKKAYIDLETAYKQIEILDRNIISAEQDKILSEENYKVGLGTLLDVQTASTKLNSLKIDKINAYYDFLLAEKRLNYYSGELSY